MTIKINRIILVAFQLAVLGLSNSAYAITEVYGNSKGVWTLEKSPYHVIGYRTSILIEAGDTLIIEPGAEVVFTLANQSIDVYGTLIAKGTNFSDQTINFNGIENDGFRNIYFHSQSFGILEYCTITGGVGDNGVVFIEHLNSEPCQVFVKNNFFIHSGIYLTMWSPYVLCDNIFFHSNVAIRFEPIATNDEIRIFNNQIDSCSIGIDVPSHPNLKVFNNYISNCDEGIVVRGQDSYNWITEVYQNELMSNRYAIKCDGFGEINDVARIHNNIIDSSKVGISCFYGKIEIANNIIQNSVSEVPLSDYGKGITGYNSEISIHHNLFYNNQINDVDGSATLGAYNLFQNPVCRGGVPFDYHLKQNSPCIDAGDPSFPVPTDGGLIVDIGKYEYSGNTLQKHIDSLKTYTFGKSKIKLEVLSAECDTITVQLFDAHHPLASRSLPSYYVISAKGTCTANLYLYYSDENLNGFEEDELTIWKHLTDWEGPFCSDRNIAENWVRFNGIAPFADFILTDKQNSSLLVKLKTFLEGAYLKDINEMSILLNTNTSIPLQSPYLEDKRSISSMPPDITDWVLVQLRNTQTGDVTSSKSVLLSKNGSIVADDGVTDEIEMQGEEGLYLIDIRHRNHLAVRSTQSAQLSKLSSTLYDFTVSEDRGKGIHPLKQIDAEPILWGLWAGDMNQDGQLTTKDYVLWYQANNGIVDGYSNCDTNLDTKVDIQDCLMWQCNAKEGACFEK